jgi:hypothetical protein
MYCWTREFHMIVNEDTVVIDGHNCRVSQAAMGIKSGPYKCDIIGLPFTRRTAGIDERGELSVNGGRHPIGIGGVVEAVKDLDFVFAHRKYSTVPAPLAFTGNNGWGCPFNMELAVSESLDSAD